MLLYCTDQYLIVFSSVSAASQAITTYIRAHLQRCDTQQDQPLLLKHTLSGTRADDDLLPALHSTSGGASMSSEARVTNFRRGTVVWYLSRVTGAPCPFSRAGIRLSEYVDVGAPQPVSKKRREFEQCGQKRKRRSARECVLKQAIVPEPTRESLRSTSLSLPSDDESEESDYSDESSDSEQPPPAKVKLTLKLPPLARVRAATAAAAIPYRRSPSVPYSVASAASPPPDSDEEDSDSDSSDSDSEIDAPMDVDIEVNIDEGFSEDFYEDDAQLSDEWDDDNDDEELSTTWESPGPRSPSAQPPTFRVKEEPQDVQGLLDQWEYDLDVKETVVKSEDSPYPPFDWEWDSHGPSSSPSSTSVSSPIQTRIKQEDDFDLNLSFSGPSFTDWRQCSALSPTTPFGFTFGEESDIFPMSPGAFPVSPTSPTTDYPSFRPRSHTVPPLSLGGFLPGQFPETPSRPPSDPSIANSLSSLVHSLSVNSPTAQYHPHSLFGSSRLFSESNEESEPQPVKELPPPCVSPSDIRIEHDADGLDEPGLIVVNTCEPCVPQIFATHIAGMFRHKLNQPSLIYYLFRDRRLSIISRLIYTP